MFLCICLFVLAGFVQLAPWISNNAPAGIRWAQTAGYGHVPNPAMPNTFQVSFACHTHIYLSLGLGLAGHTLLTIRVLIVASNCTTPLQAIAFDLTDYNGPFGSVHIRDKTTVGKRLALGGISQAYVASQHLYILDAMQYLSSSRAEL